jgi:hypothetical protein
MKKIKAILLGVALSLQIVATAGEEFHKPYSPPCVERENVFEFTEKPAMKFLGDDRYEITFAVKGYCDATVAIIDPDPGKELVKGRGVVVRHLASGVLGPNAPAPFQKNSLKQKIYWDGKCDLDDYVREPGKLRVRVMLGLKPEFDKRLGGTSAKNLPGGVGGLAAGPDGVYVFMMPGMFSHGSIRKFDHDGNYVHSLTPPPADLPENKLGGMGFVEYESGKRAMLGPDLTDSINHSAAYLPTLNYGLVGTCQPALAGNRLLYTNQGQMPGSPQSNIHYTFTDGSTDLRGMKGLMLVKSESSMRGPGGGPFHQNPRLATSPDGKTAYIAGLSKSSKGAISTCVYARSLESEEPGRLFAGEFDKPGSDNNHFGGVQGLDCDTEGRVYVADMVNNRIQVFAAEGKYLKTIPMDRPNLICVHKKTGAIYVLHQARVQGKSVPRVTKLASFADPREELHFDGVTGMMALDSWSEKPRLWFSGFTDGRFVAAMFKDYKGPNSVTIWEERGKTFEKFADFEADARKDAGANWIGRWHGIGSLSGSKTICDPTREKAYYAKSHIFDLRTGTYEGSVRHPGSTDDIAFDKRGYMHAHFNPCFFIQGSGRFDPAAGSLVQERGEKYLKYPECPYDYGIEKGALRGILPTKDQAGAKGFQDGLGVNMKGDVAVQTNIYHVPKMDDEAKEFALQGSAATTAAGHYNEEELAYSQFLRSIQEAEKRGEAVFFIKRSPGIALSGGTVWTFDSYGELHKECAVIAGDLVNGVMLDEDLSVYFVSARPQVYAGRPFLYGRGGHFGDPKSKRLPFTGTFIKTKPDALCRLLYKKSAIPLDPIPARPPELAAIDFPDDQADNNGDCWVDGAEWLYAGASPISNVGCSCPAQRLHLD